MGNALFGFIFLEIDPNARIHGQLVYLREHLGKPKEVRGEDVPCKVS